MFRVDGMVHLMDFTFLSVLTNDVWVSFGLTILIILINSLLIPLINRLIDKINFKNNEDKEVVKSIVENTLYDLLESIANSKDKLDK